MNEPETKDETTYKLHDETIAGLMQLLQLALATHTNIMDHLRMMELEVVDDDKLKMTPAFMKRVEGFADQLMEKLEAAADEDEGEEASFGFFNE